MDKQLFDRAIGEAPPSTVDVDAILARERRAARLRGMANPWVATAAGVMALTFATAAVILPSGSDGGAQGPGNPPPTDQPGCAPAPTEPAADATTRLTEVLNRLVRGQLRPGAELAPNSAQDPRGPQRGPLEVVHHPDRPSSKQDVCRGFSGIFGATADVSRGQERGNIVANVENPVFPGSGAPAPRCDDPESPLTFCDRGTGPTGEVVVATTYVTESGATSYTVRVAKPDGTLVALVAENVAGSTKLGSGPQSLAPPLDHQQLTAIALDPGMTLYP